MIACHSLSLLYFPFKYLLSQKHTIGLQSWSWVRPHVLQSGARMTIGKAREKKSEQKNVSACLAWLPVPPFLM